MVFLFPGQGGQWVGMGRGLLAGEPVFAQTMERCDAALRALEGWSLLEALQAPGDDPRLGRIAVVQPLLLAMEVSLAALWRSWGVEPAAVIGHSMGEAAAAHVAGALSLEDAVGVIARRSRLMAELPGGGAMMAVSLDADRARAVTGNDGRVSVAAVNGPADSVLSGEREALARVRERLEARGVRCRAIAVDVASHSPAVDPLAEPLRRELAGLAPRPARVPLLSTALGRGCPEARDGARLYDRLNATGNHWGPAFQGVRHLWRGPGEVLARVEAPATIAADVERHLFHPALLDACGQALVELSPEQTGPFVLASLERVATFAAPRGVLWAHIVERGCEGRDLVGDVRIYDARGAQEIQARVLDGCSDLAEQCRPSAG